VELVGKVEKALFHPFLSIWTLDPVSIFEALLLEPVVGSGALGSEVVCCGLDYFLEQGSCYSEFSSLEFESRNMLGVVIDGF